MGGFAEAKYLPATSSFSIHGFSVSRWLQRTVASLCYRRRVIYAYPEFFVTLVTDTYVQFAIPIATVGYRQEVIYAAILLTDNIYGCKFIPRVLKTEATQ